MRVETGAPLFLSQFSRRSNVGLAHHPRQRTRFGPNGSTSTNDPMLSISQFCQYINCSPTFFYQWKRKLAADPKDAQSCVFKPPSPPSTPWRLNSPLEFQSSFRYRKKLGDCPRFLVKSAYVPGFPRNRMRLEEALEVARKLLGKLRRIRAV